MKTLKQALKARGLTYAKVAAGIKMSEASVKRMFATGHISLQRLDRICALVEIELTDLLRLHEESQHRISHLEEAQETELVRDPRRLLVAICVRGGWSVADIVDHYDFAETECIRFYVRIPQTVLFGVYLVAMLTMVLIGVQGSYSGKRNYPALTIMILILCVVILIIIDLDRPSQGLIQVPQKALLDLQQQLQAQP